MLKILPYKDSESGYRTILHGSDVFHEALRFAQNGETYFHVSNPEGEDYDLEYFENNNVMLSGGRIVDKVFLPPFYLYDETRTEDLDMDIFRSYDSVYFDELNEYSVVLIRLLLSLTEKAVYIKDEKILRFVKACERLHIGEAIPKCGVFEVLSDILPRRIITQTKDNVCNVFLNVFFFQWLGAIPLKQVKYIFIAFGKEEGIGSVLRLFFGLGKGLKKYGIRLILDRSSVRFPNSMLDRYFTFESIPDDMNESNTLYITNFYPLIRTAIVNENSDGITYEIFRPEFRAQIDEYRNGVFGSKRIIGVLMRGTDYVTTGLGSKNSQLSQAPAQRVAEKLHFMMAGGRYDGIFLATEDRDILDYMVSEFPGKIRAVSQDRHRVSDFHDVLYLSDLEKQLYKEEDYENAVDDTITNYLYALYIVSKCTSFVCAGLTAGYNIITSLNHGRFEEEYIVSES